MSAIGAGIAIASVRQLNTAKVIYLGVAADADQADASTLVADVHSDLMLHAVVEIAGLAALTLLSVVIRRPWRIARIGAWISALLLSFGLALVLASSPETLVSPDGSDPPAVSKALADLLIGWYPAVTSVIAAAQLAAIFAFSLLLLRTASGEFYQRQREDGPAGLWTFAPRSDS
jgi:branched-subunit amino acid ABC-type transport system permease component